MRESLKKYFSNPLARKRLSASMKKFYSRSASRKKLSLAMKKRYARASERKRTSIQVKRYFNEHPLSKNPEVIQKIDRAVTKWWKEHPNIRKERSEAIKNLFITNPERFKKFMRYGNNSFIPKFKTKQNFLVRSHGEKQIADFLFDNKINALYEQKVLIFKQEGQICVPDFYLPEYNTYIEFYGGFPSAWKKKVMKNKLYKKHKIPCIFITPAELRNLNYYLARGLVN